MSIDAGIYNLANKPTTQLESYGDLMGQKLSMANAINQNKMGNMQVQSQQQDMQDQQTMRALSQKGQFKSFGDLADAAQAAGVSPKMVMGLRSQDLEQQQKRAQLQEALGKVDEQRRNAIHAAADDTARLAASAQSPEQFNAGLMDLAKQHQGVLGAPQMTMAGPTGGAASLPQTLQKYYVNSPDEFNAKKGMALTNAMPVLSVFNQMKGEIKDTGNQLVNIKLDAMGNVISKTPIMDKEIAPGELMKFANDVGAIKPDGSVDMNNPQVKAKLKKETNIPVTRISIDNGQSRQGAWAENKNDYAKPLPNVAAEGLARDFADGKPQPNITSRTPAWVSDAITRGRAIYKNANNGDDQGYGTNSGVLKQARLAWAPGGAMRNTSAAVDVATGHLAARDQFIEALKSSDAAKMNEIKNYFKTQFNLSTAPNDLRTINGLVAPEIAKVVKGSTNTNESEVQDIRKSLGDDLAEEIQKSGGQVFRGAMGTRLENMENQYKEAYPGKSLARILLPATVNTFPHIFGGAVQPKDGQWGPAQASGNPDRATLGQNPRFRDAAWANDGPNGKGWYHNNGDGTITRVE